VRRLHAARRIRHSCTARRKMNSIMFARDLPSLCAILETSSILGAELARLL
jgi:hypothetical protein